MVNNGWIIASVGTVAIIAVVSIIMIQRMLQGKRYGFLPQEGRTFNQETISLGSSLIVLGIVFGTNRLISYSFIGAGVLFLIISVIRSKRGIKT